MHTIPLSYTDHIIILLLVSTQEHSRSNSICVAATPASYWLALGYAWQPHLLVTGQHWDMHGSDTLELLVSTGIHIAATPSSYWLALGYS